LRSRPDFVGNTLKNKTEDKHLENARPLNLKTFADFVNTFPPILKTKSPYSAVRAFD
jgi:hypothetical protein